MSAKFRIIFLCVGVLVSGSWGAHDAQRSGENKQLPLWYQLQQREIRADNIGSSIFLGVAAFSFIATLVFSYFFDALKKN